jgi:phosphatidylglycerophosphatase A
VLAAFILFRAFDIWKPYPVRRLEGMKGGTGIMADDLGAGIYAALILLVLCALGF